MLMLTAHPTPTFSVARCRWRIASSFSHSKSDPTAMSSAAPTHLAHVLQITPVATAAGSTQSADPSPPPSRPPSLDEHFSSLSATLGLGSDQSLAQLLHSLSACVASISTILRSTNVNRVGSHNRFGDDQLNVDVATHQSVLHHLRASGVCATASSEEEPVHIDLTDSLRPGVGREQVFSVSFDPLDGSSIIDANFAVGSIFSVFGGRELLGQRVSDQKACAIAVYGPRTTLIVGLPGAVFEATLDVDGHSWFVSRPQIRLRDETKTFAPANLRSAQDDPVYQKLVQFYLENKYTLRYSGGLVPDFAHALIKGHGVFLSPVSGAAPAKLRLAYECAALSMLSVWAGGAAVGQEGNDIRDVELTSYEQRSALIIGSRTEVERYKQARVAARATS